MTLHPRHAAPVAALALILTIAGCSNDPADPGTLPTTSATGASTPPTPTPSASPSGSASPTLTPAEQAAVTAARPPVDDYMRVTDKSMQDPTGFDDSRLAKVAISSALADAQDDLAHVRENKYHQIGETVITEVALLDVDLRFKPKRTPPYIPTVQFCVDYDVSNLVLVDRKGTKITDPDRPSTGVVRVGVSNYEYPDGPWLTSYLDWDGDQC